MREKRWSRRRRRRRSGEKRVNETVSMFMKPSVLIKVATVVIFYKGNELQNPRITVNLDQETQTEHAI